MRRVQRDRIREGEAMIALMLAACLQEPVQELEYDLHEIALTLDVHAAVRVPQQRNLILLSATLRKAALFSIADRKITKEVDLKFAATEVVCRNDRIYFLAGREVHEWKLEDWSPVRIHKLSVDGKNLNVLRTHLYLERYRQNLETGEVEAFRGGGGRLDEGDDRFLYGKNLLEAKDLLDPSVGSVAYGWWGLDATSSYSPCGSWIVTDTQIKDRLQRISVGSVRQGTVVADQGLPYFGVWESGNSVWFYRWDTFRPFARFNIRTNPVQASSFFLSNGSVVAVPRAQKKLWILEPRAAVGVSESLTVSHSPPPVLRPGESLDFEIRTLETESFKIALVAGPPGLEVDPTRRRLLWTPAPEEFLTADPVREIRVALVAGSRRAEVRWTIGLIPDAVTVQIPDARYQFDSYNNGLHWARWSLDRRFLLFCDWGQKCLVIVNPSTLERRQVNFDTAPMMFATTRQHAFVTFSKSASGELVVVDLEAGTIVKKHKPQKGKAWGVVASDEWPHLIVACQIDVGKCQFAIFSPSAMKFTGWLKQAKSSDPVLATFPDSDTNVITYGLTPDGRVGSEMQWFQLSKDGLRGTPDDYFKRVGQIATGETRTNRAFVDRPRGRVYVGGQVFNLDLSKKLNVLQRAATEGPPSYDTVVWHWTAEWAPTKKRVHVVQFLNPEDFRPASSFVMPLGPGGVTAAFFTDQHVFLLDGRTLLRYPAPYARIPASLKRAIPLDPEIVRLRKEADTECKKGEVALSAGDWKNAETAILKALKLQPRGRAALLLARLRQKQGDVAAAERALVDAVVRGLDAPADHREAHLDLAKMWVSQKQPGRAETMLLGLLRAQPDAKDGYVALAALYADLGAYASAWAIVQAGSKRIKNDPALPVLAQEYEAKSAESAVVDCPSCSGLGGTCAACDKTGKVVRTPCVDCLGSGTVVQQKEVVIGAGPVTVSVPEPCPACAGRGFRYRKK